MKLIDYGDDDFYEKPDFPIRHYVKLGVKRNVLKDGKLTDDYRRIWRFDLPGLLFDRWNGLFSRHGWSRNLYPSWGSGFSTLWNNICMFATPWYHPRRRLLSNLYNRNESKLLTCNRKSCSFRNRATDQRYFYAHMGFLYGSLEIDHYAGEDGLGRNAFVDGVLAGLSGKELPKIRETHTVVIKRMPILTMRQCERFFDEAVRTTKDYLTWNV